MDDLTLPDEQGLRRWLRERKRVAERQRKRSSGVLPSLVTGLGSISEALWKDNRHRESLEAIDLTLGSVRDVRDRTARLSLSYMGWKSRAFIASQIGLFRDSIDAYRRAVSFGDKGPYEDEHPQSAPGDTRELASMYFRIGDYEESLALLDEAEDRLGRYASKLSSFVRDDESARIHAARSLLYLDLGEYETAEACAQEAVRLHEALAGEPILGRRRLDRVLQTAIDYGHLGNARRERARITESGFEEAHAAYDSSFRMLADTELRKLVASGGDRVLAEEVGDREADANLERGRTYLLEGEYGKANDDLQRALSLTSTSNLLMHAAIHYLYLGQARAGLGMNFEAEESFEEAVRLAEEHGTPETAWQALREVAKLRRSDGRHQEATDTLRRCVAAIEGLRQQNLPETTKISMLAVKEGAYEDLVIGLCSGPGGEMNGNPEMSVEAFGYAEGAKSRVFAERLGSREILAAGVPVKLRRREAELSRQLREFQAGSRQASSRPPDDAQGTYDWSGRVAKIEERLRRIRLRIAGSGPTGKEYVALRQGDPLSYEGARRLLEAGGEEGEDRVKSRQESGASPDTRRVVLLDYFVTENEVLIFIGRKDFSAPVVRRVRIPRETLSGWAFEIENTEAEDLGAWDLDRWQRELGPLVEPLAEYSAENDMVWIVPHAQLHLLPLHALKVGGRYLAERNPIVYSPSASVMPYCRAKQVWSSNSALILGDSLPAPDNLVHAREEAVAVAGLFEVEPLLGERATRRQFEAELRQLGGHLRVLHIACHGKFDYAKPLRSRILLAPPVEDGLAYESPDLSAEEVLKLNVDADLVVLSACASGVSGRRGGDELIGLTRSFLYAGASSMIVGLWYVADASTRILMGRFYEHMLNLHDANVAAVRGKAEALRCAQRSVIRTEGYEHPYFWSPFVLVGNWR